MKLRLRIFTLLLLVVASQLTLAQTDSQKKQITSHYNISKLQKLQSEISQTYQSEKAKAIRYALKNNIKTVIEKPNGGISILERVMDDGALIYITTYNDGAAQTVNTKQVYAGGSIDLNLTGAGIDMGIWDGGLVRLSHQEFDNRVSQIDAAADVSNHATHVAGTMMASGIIADAKGMAFQSTLKAYDFGNNLTEIAIASQDGMILSNHSYGFAPDGLEDEIFGAYVYETRITDEIVYNSPYHLPVFAAGNSNIGQYNTSKDGYDLITGYNLAKNILSVANTLEVADYVDASSVTISKSSSWGPTDDGRIKPDISAKGTETFSSVGVADNAYATFTGTSMAAPSVTGSIALLHQHYNNLNNAFLNAASMKSLVIHTAREAGEAPGPDYTFGWGLMNTADAANLITNEGFTNIIEENTLNNNSSYGFTVEAIDPNQPLVATIVWTDPAGEIQDISTADDPTPRLVNDLDLRITSPDGSTTYLPWKLDVANPGEAATNGDNIVDNVEKIEIPNAEGQYNISVSHKGNLQNDAQDYTIVVSGIAVSNFNITSSEATKTYCENETATFNIKLHSLDSFAETVTFSASDIPLGLDPSFSTSSITNEGMTVFTINNLSSVASGTYPFTISGTDGTETSTLNLNLKIESTDPISNVSLVNPTENETQVSNVPVLNWEPVSRAISYQVQLSTDDDFSNLILDEITKNPQLTIRQSLDDGQRYYWRVRPLNNCVTGSYSSSSFTTISLECFPYTYATDTPIEIESSSPNTQQSIINIPDELKDVVIQDINVSVDITHTWVSDLSISLVSPSGTFLTLLQGQCSDNNDIDVIFDDSGAMLICSDLEPTLSGIIKPQMGSLARFIGESPAGEWTLIVNDGFELDGGFINNFGIEVCYAKVDNDDACDATPLIIDNSSAGDAFTVLGATAQANEPNENLDGGVNGSVWFSFVGPSFGNVKVTTDIEGGTLTDSELAVYSSTNCEDFNTYTQIGYDKDSGTLVGSGKMSELNLNDLNPGETYYIQVDRSNVAVAGSFGIEVRSQTLSNTAFNSSDFQIYPNPTTGVLQILGIQKEVSVQIFDLLGREVMSFEKINNNQELDVQSLSIGVYLLKVEAGQSSFSKKIIKE